MKTRRESPLKNELGALLSQHSQDDIFHATPYVLWKLGLVADCPPSLQPLLLKVAIIARLDPSDDASAQKMAIGNFYRKYPPHKDLVDELMRILRDASLPGDEALKALSVQVSSYNPQPLDPSKQVAGGVMGMFNAAKLFDENNDKS